LAEALHVPLIAADARVKRTGLARCNFEAYEEPGLALGND
jgi:hypothetical protein